MTYIMGKVRRSYTMAHIFKDSLLKEKRMVTAFTSGPITQFTKEIGLITK